MPPRRSFSDFIGHPKSGSPFTQSWHFRSRNFVGPCPRSRYDNGVDFSAILIIPYSVFITVAVLAGALLLKRSRPRLIWPFAFATLTAASVFMGLPRTNDFGLWLASLLGLAIWAAVGTIIGVAIVKLSMATVRALKGE